MDTNNSYLIWISFSLLTRLRKRRDKTRKTIIRLDIWTKEHGRILVMSLNQSDHDAMSKKYIKVLDELPMADILGEFWQFDTMDQRFYSNSILYDFADLYSLYMYNSFNSYGTKGNQ